MVSIGSDGGLVGPNPEGGPVVDLGVFWSVGVESMFRFGWSVSMGLEVLIVLGVDGLDLKNPGLGSRKPQKPGPLGGVGVGCRLRRVIRFYRTLTTVWTCEAKKPRWPKNILTFYNLFSFIFIT